MAANPRRLTDEQLSVARLEIDDPLAVDNLHLDRPPADLLPEIVGEYHLATDGDPIWCCHCQAHRHWNGFVITNVTGAKFLIGSACGPNHYKLSFAYARNQHRALTRRKGVLERMEAICAAAEAVQHACHDILHSEGLTLIDRKRDELKRAAEGVFGLLATSVQNESPLSEMVSVRDRDAERRRDERLPDDKKGGPIYVQEPRSLGTLAGAELVRRKGDCRDRLLALREAVQAVVALRASGTDAHSLGQLTKVVRQAEECWSAAEAAIVEAEAAPAFFSPENMTRIERWSTTYRHFDLRAEGSSLRLSGDKFKTATISPLGAISLGRIPKMKLVT